MADSVGVTPEGLLRLVSTKTWVNQLESPLTFLLYFIAYLKFRDLVSCQLIEACLQTVVECYPWFPDEGSFDLEIWHWVKRTLNKLLDKEKIF